MQSLFFPHGSSVPHCWSFYSSIRIGLIYWLGLHIIYIYIFLKYILHIYIYDYIWIMSTTIKQFCGQPKKVRVFTDLPSGPLPSLASVGPQPVVRSSGPLRPLRQRTTLGTSLLCHRKEVLIVERLHLCPSAEEVRGLGTKPHIPRPGTVDVEVEAAFGMF